MTFSLSPGSSNLVPGAFSGSSNLVPGAFIWEFQFGTRRVYREFQFGTRRFVLAQGEGFGESAPKPRLVAVAAVSAAAFLFFAEIPKYIRPQAAVDLAISYHLVKPDGVAAVDDPASLF